MHRSNTAPIEIAARRPVRAADLDQPASSRSIERSLLRLFSVLVGIAGNDQPDEATPPESSTRN